MTKTFKDYFLLLFRCGNLVIIENRMVHTAQTDREPHVIARNPGIRGFEATFGPALPPLHELRFHYHYGPFHLLSGDEMAVLRDVFQRKQRGF